MCGLILLALPAVATAQAPRYQSPINAPTPQTRLAVPATTPITPNGEVVEDVVVRVNDQIISRSDLERSVQQMQQEMQQANASPADIAERQQNLLRDLIDQQLLLSRGKELGINVDAEVIRRLDEVRKQYKMDTMEDLERAARQQGVSFEDFRAGIRNQIITQQVVRDEVGRHLQMTQSQEQAYYNAHKQEFAQPEQVRLSEILIPTPADATEAQIAQAQAKATEVETKLKGGESFDAVAKTYSGGPTAAQGGDLGQFKRGALAKVLEDQTFSLKAGEFTAPIRTRQGFVVLKVTEHNEAGVPTLKEIEPQVQEAMYSEQMQPALRAYLTKLREDAYIDIKPGYIDGGASGKETKPVFTAYTAPVVKKKTVVQKQRFDRGGHFSETKGQPAAAPAAPAADAATTAAAPTATASTAAPATTASTTTAAPSTAASNHLAPITKNHKVKREKVRFGQAPRDTLPARPVTGMATDNGLGADHERIDTVASASASAPAPGTAIAPLETASNTSDVNPLEPQQGPQKKTRFAAKAVQFEQEKKQKKASQLKEKVISAAPTMTDDEQAAAATQSAPLGLNGDTAKKPKKPKRQKGEAKERLQNQAPKPPAPLPEETPSKAPDRGTPYEGTAGPARTPQATDSSTAPASAPPQQ